LVCQITAPARRTLHNAPHLARRTLYIAPHLARRTLHIAPHPALRTLHIAPHPALRTSHPALLGSSTVHRFFAPALDPGDEFVALPKDEAEHLTRVLRLGVGDTVAIFDGRGGEFSARVVDARRRDVRVQLLTRIEPTPEPPVSLTLVQAVLKGDKMDDVVRDAVMLGVAAIQPIVTKRAEVTVAALMRGARVDRWRRVALASAKQSRRAVVPEIRTPLAFGDVMREPASPLRIMLVEPSASTDVEPLSALRREPAPLDAAVWVGPEGGWEASEWTAARAEGVRLMSFGRRTLRADAVPIAVVSALALLWEM
jgi:16S rRNA (uracil1498-N3)-methyltransferase